MIAVTKLLKLTPKHAARKAANTLDLAERAFRAGDASFWPWMAEYCAAFSAMEYLPDELKALMRRFAGGSAPADAAEGARLANALRRGLEAYGGVSPADWDFMEPLGLVISASSRRVYPGMRAYLEDLRSPFNVGSIFRTADAFGFSELLLSGFVPDPAHPRAERSALGATAVVPWRRAGLEALGEARDELGADAVFALELRGEPIADFTFPERGVAVLGSEELGVSPEALALCGRRVSIPMLGAKGSLNVGVAFGVLAYAWGASLAGRGAGPSASSPPLRV